MIDQSLRKFHQFIVDRSNRCAEWWMENMAYAYLVIGICKFGIAEEKDMRIFVLLFLECIMAGYLWIGSRNQTARHVFKSPFLRFYFLAWAVYRVALILMTFASSIAIDAMTILFLLSSLVTLSAFYFAVCEPPRPPKSRKKFVLSSEGA